MRKTPLLLIQVLVEKEYKGCSMEIEIVRNGKKNVWIGRECDDTRWVTREG